MPSKKLAQAGLSKSKFDRCVADVKSTGKNGYAICTASFNKHYGIKPRPMRSKR